MINKILIITVFFVTVSCQQNIKKNINDDSIAKTYMQNPNNVSINYPTTKTVDVEEDFFGIKVKDPYRWLEEAVTEEPDKDINIWVTAQSRLARKYLDSIKYKDKIAKRMEALYDYKRESAPFREGGKIYFYRNNGLQSQSVVYQKESFDGEEKVFLDPNKFSEDGTVSLSGLSFSKDGRYAAYKTSESGSDWGTVFIRDTETGKDLDDKIDWLRYSGVSWYKNGFFYSRYGDNKGDDKFTQKNQFHKVYYHQVGTTQKEDELIYSDRNMPNRNYGVSVTESESFLILSMTESTSGNALYYKKSTDTERGFYPLVDDFEHDFWVIDNLGDKLLVQTNYNAPKYQVLAIDVNKPDKKDWEVLIPEQKNATLNGVQVIGNRLMVRYTKEITNVITVYDLDGKLIGDIQLPSVVSKTAPITLSGLTGKKDMMDAYFTISSFTLPSTICKLNVASLKSEIWKRPDVKFNPDDFKTEYTHYKSKDGTLIPISIVYKKGIKKEGNTPALLYGYGGFNISILPRFALNRLPFLEKGGIYAVANIRGGGEMGQEWHEAGIKLKKQNVFDDFIAAAEFLINEKYTSSKKLAIEGRSNGGLLVGACMTQRPELYRAALPIVGVMDMMRYHQFTIGHFWASDYGRSDDSTQYKNLLSYSPVHNVRPAEYPATMVMTADHDDRVVPAHSFKFGAALQANNTGKMPMIIRIDRKAGHGSGKPIKKVIEEETDKIAFLMFNLGMDW
ncbi:MAG: prolyl oligopeptidase family serine peptidase [Saprospiraceae bacterium]|nr:prolyl oligopeptidase family serine peptidase [Saprospiraceae bacterium]